jgi:hypothetical protein
MAEVWYPFAIRRYGAHANYERGTNSMRAVVCHYTVGVNSIGTLGRDFTFLIDRDGDVHQGCPVNAKVWHAGEPWNTTSCGIEVEYHPTYDDEDGDGPEDEEVMTEAQVEALHGLVMWLHHEWGIPLDFYDGPRVSSWHGFINHASLIQTGTWHYDYWPRADWDRIVAAPAPPPEPPRPQVALTGKNSMGISVAIVPSAGLFETFRIDSAGNVVHSWHPAANGVGAEVVASGALPRGDVSHVRQVNPDGSLGRADVYFERADGSYGHAYQLAPNDWQWYPDGAAW